MAVINVQKFTFKAVMQPLTPVSYDNVEEKTTYNESTKLYTTTKILTKGVTEYRGIGISDNINGSMQLADTDAFSKLNQASSGTVVVSTFGDGTYIREDKFAAPNYTLETAVSSARETAETFGVLDMNSENMYILEKQSTETPPPPEPEAPSPAPKEMYIPGTRVEESKFTPGGEFVVKGTTEFYKGFYLKSFKNKYYSGKTPENLGAELEKVTQSSDNVPTGLSNNILAILLELAKGAFNRKPTASEKKAGKMKRYFVKDKNTSKINETTQSVYQQAKQLPNRLFAEMDWVIQGPVEDTVFNGITYFGAETRNRQAVQNLEKTLPGISDYIQQYRYLVEATLSTPQVVGSTGNLAGTVEGANFGTNAAIGQQKRVKSAKELEEEKLQQTKDFSYLTGTLDRTDRRKRTTQVIIQRDFTEDLENSRKANFDTRK